MDSRIWDATAAPYIDLDPEWRVFFETFGLEHVAVLGGLTADYANSPRWLSHVKAFQKWLEAGRHGEMSYLSGHQDIRVNPQRLLDQHHSTFVFLIPYDVGHRVRGKIFGAGSADGVTSGKEQFASGSEPGTFRARVARYARHKDYHKVIRKRLTAMFDELEKRLEGHPDEAGFSYRVAVDSAPFLDRAHAHLGGLGFVGKNTMLIRPQLGSYFFIASVLTRFPVERFGTRTVRPAESFSDLGCGTCTRCVEACPTGALLGDHSMDASRCISYLSIEKRGPLEQKDWQAFRDWSFGCDICQEVCPYNHRTLDGRRWPEFQQEPPQLGSLSVLDVATMSKRQYEQWFGGLPLTRAKYDGLVRNALYSLYAMGDKEALRRAMLQWRECREDGAPIGAALREALDLLATHID